MLQNNDINTTKLTPDELEKQLDTIIQFLQLVHPELVSDDQYKFCVEIRPIVRGEKNYTLSRSCNIWDLSDKSNISRLRTFLNKHNDAPTCLFYSVFTYDNNKRIKNSESKLVKPNHITFESAEYTSEIALDFDNIGFEEYTKLVDRFEELNLHAIWVATGHGYHAHLLLEEPSKDKNILRQLVYKFRAKGFNCDPKCVDPARIMRLPGTFNKKYLVDVSYAEEVALPPRCEVYQETSERYTIEKILDALDTLPTVSPEDETFEKTNNSTRKNTPIKNSQTNEKGVDVVKFIEYPYLSDYELPEAVQKILTYTPKGFRNQCLGFLIKFLKKNFKLGKNQLEEILTLWANEACIPAYDPNEFKNDFCRFYYIYNGLSYTPEMAKRFGTIDFGDFITLRKKDISIPNKIFRSFDSLDGAALRAYLGIKLLEHQKTSATQESIAELLGLSVRALRPILQNLIKSGFVYKVAGNRKLGIPFSYRTSNIISKTDGFMIFSYNDIKAYITELYDVGLRGNSALKLFLFFRYKFYTGDIYMSQENLGNHIGVDRTTVSRLVSRLEELGFIRIKKVQRAVVESCEYTLLR